MSFCSRTANYLQTFIKISEWRVFLFLKIYNFTVKAFKNWRNFWTVKFLILWILAMVMDK